MRFVYSIKTQHQPEPLVYKIELDDNTLEMTSRPEEAEPEWTHLEYMQCDHCPLSAQTHEFCPIALNIHHLINAFKNIQSIEKCEVTVFTEDRVYFKSTDIQSGLGSLFGLIMATSGCPTMNFLKPMARFHLPFSTLPETIFRSLGSYLIGEFINGRIKTDGLADGLVKRYTLINSLNGFMLKRIDHLLNQKDSQDADQNAIVILDTLGSLFSMELDDNVSILHNLYKDAQK